MRVWPTVRGEIDEYAGLCLAEMQEIWLFYLFNPVPFSPPCPPVPHSSQPPLTAFLRPGLGLIPRRSPESTFPLFFSPLLLHLIRRNISSFVYLKGKTVNCATVCAQNLEHPVQGQLTQRRLCHAFAPRAGWVMGSLQGPLKLPCSLPSNIRRNWCEPCHPLTLGSSDLYRVA